MDAARLKRLEIQGFKSFASRVSLEFGSGITAVVGPNGSGKSNLADAIRWVLGEQNPRLLRLRRAEDAVYAGAVGRPQAGFAEVSLILDNSDGWLPLEFSEVSFTRRLHRSGESEFLINRRRVRLRDIIDLLLQARLGQNSYAILGQGMVDNVLSMRPEERRGLIEEAADVRRHRVKIEEAESRLAATSENLERGRLLIAEIGPRLSQLQRQAQRANEYSRLSQELADTLQALARLRWRSVTAAEAGSEQTLTQARATADGVAAVLALTEREMERARGQAAAAQQALLSAEAEVKQARESLRVAEREHEAQEGDAQRLRRRQAQAQAELQGLELELAAIEAELPDNDTAERLAMARREADRSAAALKSLSPDEVAIRQRVGAAESEQRRLQQLAVVAEERAARLSRDLEHLERESGRLAQRRRELLERLTTWGCEYAQTLTQTMPWTTRVLELERDLDDAHRQGHAAEASLSHHEQRLVDATRRLEEQRQRLERLQRERERLSPASERILALLDAIRGSGPGRPRILGMVGGLIQVQQGLEVAIEAALADALDAAVVRTQDEAQMAVEVLKSLESGRLSFFALDVLKAGHPLSLGAEAGIIGVASRFVRCEEQYRDLIEALLGRVIVAEDVPGARTILRRGLGTAVTLDGTVLRPGGAISGGRGKSDGALLRASRELTEIAPLVEQLESDQAELLPQTAPLRAQVRTAAERVRRLAAALAEARTAVRRGEVLLQKLRHRLEPLRGEAAWLRAGLREIRERRQAITAALAAREQEAVSVRTQSARQLRAELLPARQALDSLQRKRALLSAAAGEAHARLTALEREKEALVALQESRRAARARSERSIASRREELVRLQAEAEGQQLRTQQAALAILESRMALESASVRLPAMQAHMGELALTERELLQQVEQLRAQRVEAVLALAHAEQMLARAREDRERVQADLEDEQMSPANLPEMGEQDGRSLKELEAVARRLRLRIRELGGINPEAESEYRQTNERHTFLVSQAADLEQARTALVQAIEELQQLAEERFQTTFQAVNGAFGRYFAAFFGGGQASLQLSGGAASASGIEIVAQPPGKRLQALALLSGGERAMTAVALLFALLEINPAPFCVLDEIDAALDEANVGRVAQTLKELAGQSQFLVITHNRLTVQAAEQIYGVSITKEGVSRVLSLRLAEADALIA